MLRKLLLLLCLLADVPLVAVNPNDLFSGDLEKQMQELLAAMGQEGDDFKLPDFGEDGLLDEDEDFASGEEDDSDDVEEVKNPVAQAETFYATYLSVYYPRAIVIGGMYFCLNLTPEKIDQALEDIVALLKNKPWFYFQDTADGFQLPSYWEHIVDQLSIVHEFLVRLRVNGSTKQVYHPSGSLAKGNKDKYLIDYLLEDLKSVAVPQFIAFSYDYMTKLYIDAVKRDNVLDAHRYRAELVYLQQNLKKTVFEKDYQEHFASIVGSLFDLLKKRTGMTDSAIEEMAMQRAKAMKGKSNGM
jgi:hypothetical protein